MKLQLLPIAALMILGVAACGKNGEGKQLSETSTPADSLLYYTGQGFGDSYMKQAKNDSTLGTDESKKAFLRGIKDGLKLYQDDNEAYNKGVKMGIQLAEQASQFGQEMEVDFDKGYFLGGVESVLLSDSTPDIRFAQKETQRLSQALIEAKELKDKDAAEKALKEAASKQKYPQITEGLYGKELKKGDSTLLQNNDEVDVTITVTNAKGEKVDLPFPSKGRIGRLQNFPTLVSNAMMEMTSGSEWEFITTAYFLSGGRPKNIGLEPNDVLNIKIQATLIPQEEPEQK